MPVWCRHYCFSRPKAVGKCTASNLLLLEIRGNINISRADELGEFLQLDELVKEDDVALDSVFAGKPLETQTICFAMIANEIGMRGVSGLVRHLRRSRRQPCARPPAGGKRTHAIEAEFERLWPHEIFENLGILDGIRSLVLGCNISFQGR